MPAPLIEFTQFAHPQRWWLRCGPPLWLEDDRWWVRAFRVTLVLGLIGTASGWITLAGLYAGNIIDFLLDGVARWFTEGAIGFICGPGLWFGVVTLIPLSRWLGRGWIMSLLSVPASMLACYCGMMTYFFVSPIMSSHPPDWIPGGKDAAGFYAGFVGAAIVGIWMGHPLRRSAWLAGIAAATLAGVGCGLYFLNPPEGNVPFASGEIGRILGIGMLYVTFQSLAAMGLGIRLWVKDQENRFHSTATAVS